MGADRLRLHRSDSVLCLMKITHGRFLSYKTHRRWVEAFSHLTSRQPQQQSQTTTPRQHSLRSVPAGPPSRGGDVVVYVKGINQPELADSFLFCSCVYFCLYGPFNCILFHQFSRHLSAFSLCSSCLNSALLALSTIRLYVKDLPQPSYNPLWLTWL